MNTHHYSQIRFLKSVADCSQLPPDTGAEVAFAGRSNVGKSSVLNTLTAIHKIARTSKTPGRTQLINFFEFEGDHQKRLVDLPGYGYAKVPKPMQAHWQELVGNYCEHRHSLKGLILVMDIRHPLKPMDCQLIEWATAYQRPIHILLNKADKLNRGPANQVLFGIQAELRGYEDLLSVQLFSALKKSGIDDLKQTTDRWLNSPQCASSQLFPTPISTFKGTDKG